MTKLPKTWEVKALGEITSIIGDGLHGTPKYSQNGDFYFINGSNLTLNAINMNINTKKVDYNEFLKYKKPFNKNTIFVSINGTLGKTALYNNEKIVLGKSVCYLNIEPQYNKYFILYFLQSHYFIGYAMQKATGSTIKNLSLKAMRELPIPLPPLDTQKQIVEILESKFAKIENATNALNLVKKDLVKLKASLLNSAFNGTLLEMSLRGSVSSVAIHKNRADKDNGLLRSDFISARNDRMGKPYNDAHLSVIASNEVAKQSTTLRHCHSDSPLPCHCDSNSTLPCHSERSEESLKKPNNTESTLPHLPQDWEVKTLGEVCEIVTGSTPSKKNAEYYGNDYPFYKPTDLNNGYFVDSALDNVSLKGYEISRQLQSGSVLVTCIGATIGKTGLIRKEGICNQQINAILPSDNFLPEFMYFYCISPKFQELIKTNASSTTLPILNKNNFAKLPIPLPPLDTQKQIVEILESKFKGIEKLHYFVNDSLNKLTKLKASLLNKAFSGELVC